MSTPPLFKQSLPKVLVSSALKKKNSDKSNNGNEGRMKKICLEHKQQAKQREEQSKEQRTRRLRKARQQTCN